MHPLSSLPLRVLIADDHPVFLKGLASEIEKALSPAEVRLAANGQELLRLLKEAPADIVFLDLRMPVLTGWEVLPVLRKEFPATPVIIITNEDRPELAAELLERGALGFLLKNADTALYPQAIASVLKGEHFVQPSLAPAVLQRKLAQPSGTLSKPLLPRHGQRVLELMAQDLTTRQMAAELGLKEDSVTDIRKKLYLLSGKEGAAGLVLWAKEQGFLG